MTKKILDEVTDKEGKDQVDSVRLKLEAVDQKNNLRLAGSEPYAINARAGSSYSIGCRVVARVTEIAALHETKSIIFRHELSGDLIVAFRGTATNKQVKTDLMTSRIGVDLDTFLATTSTRQRIRLEKEGMFSHVSLDAMLDKLASGEKTNVPLADLLPRVEMKPLPDYLQDACKSC